MNDLTENLNNVRVRIGAACRAAGRDPAEVTILAVSKKHPAARIRALHALGQTAFGENRMQEALPKISELEDLDIEWHFIGPLQSNKTAEAATHFDWVQSVDRLKILRRLSSQRPPRMTPLNVLLQVNIDREPQKSGAAPEQAAELATEAAGLPGLRLRGLMAIPRMASADHDPADSYRRMHRLYLDLIADGHALDTLSTGMSDDFEAAILHGSTMVRIGTALMGQRPR
jgi:pyridoxal phosphate enzyme (YggS family)